MKRKHIADLSIRITNNTALLQQIDILGNVTPNWSANNPLNATEFDLAHEDFIGVSKLTLTYRTPLVIPPAVLTAVQPVSTFTIAGVVAALNLLGLGVFYSVGTRILVNSNYYTYLSLQLN